MDYPKHKKKSADDKSNNALKPANAKANIARPVINSKRLRNKAIHYLGRFASTEHKLADVLSKFVKRKYPDIPASKASEPIAETVAWCREYGFVNNAQFAEMKVKSGRRKGQSAKQLKQKLFQSGLSQE